MDKAYEQWKEMPVIQKTCQAFKNHLEKSYMHYNTHKKSTAASHINGTAANHAQEKYTQRMTADALQSLSNMTIEDKKSMANLTSINLTLSKSLTHPQEKILSLSKNMQTLQAHMNTKKPATDNNKREKKSNNYFWNHVITCNKNQTRPMYNKPKERQQVVVTLENRIGVSVKWCKEYGNH